MRNRSRPVLPASFLGSIDVDETQPYAPFDFLPARCRFIEAPLPRRPLSLINFTNARDPLAGFETRLVGQIGG